MRKFVVSVFIFCCFSSAGAVDSTKQQEERPYQILLGLNIYDFDYREDLAPPFKSTEKGLLLSPSIAGRIYFHNLNKSFLHADLEYSGLVETHFDGSSQTGVPITGVHTHVFFRGEIDFYWHFRSGFHLYTGIGYRYWDRFLSGGVGYQEIYTWNYFPLGFLFEFPMTSQWKLGFDFSYWAMTDGKLKVIFSRTVSGGDDSDLILGNRSGFRTRIPIEYTQRPGTPYSFVMMPWYVSSEIGESDYVYNSTPTIAGLIKEPASTTVQFGLILGLKAHF